MLFFTLYYMYLHYTHVGTNSSVDPAIQKQREYNRRHYQQRKEKKLAETNANMYAHTPIVATQHLSGLTRETTIGKKIYILCSCL